MGILEERHKLPRRVVLTRWLSSAEAVRVVLNCRHVYINFFINETNENANDILELLGDSYVLAWYACMHDVLPVLRRMNILFQSSLPLPHLLFAKISSAKTTLINMVGTGGARTNLISLESVDVNTSFGAYANKFVQNNSGRAAVHGTALDDRQVLSLKKSWHKLYAHCLQQIDSRFPQENMHIFKLMQVIDPSIVHGPLRRQLIGTDDLVVVVGHLLHIFEIPVHTAEIASLEEIKNSFVAFRASEFCADLWKEMTKDYAGLRQRGKPIDYTLIYPYYKQLMHHIPSRAHDNPNNLLGSQGV